MKKNSIYRKYELLLFSLLLISILSYEFLFCNSIFIRSILLNDFNTSLYVFSFPRLIVYGLLILLCLFVKNKVITNATNKDHDKNKILRISVLVISFVLIIYLYYAKLLNIMTVGILIIFINYLLLLYFFIGKSFKLNILLVCIISVIYTISCETFHLIDEVSHVPTTYNIAHGNFTSEHVYLDTNLARIKILSNYKENEDLFIHYTPDKKDITGDGLYLYDNPSKILHIPSALGMLLSEKLGGTLMDTYYIGRLFSSLTFLALTAVFLKILKYKKKSFIAVLTTPFLLLLAGTYSVDGYGFIFIALFIAYLFNIYKDTNIKKISMKNLLILILLMFLVSLFKGGTYCFVFLLLFLIRKKIPKKYYIGLAIGLLSIILVSYLTTYSTININSGDTRGGNTNMLQQLKFLFSSPFVFAKVYILHFMNTFLNSNFYQQLINPYFFGKYSYIFVIPYVLFVVYMGLSDDIKLNKKELIICLLIALMTFGFTSTALYLGFTEIGKTEIAGYQARYIFQFLPIILMCLKNNHIRINNTDNSDFVILYIILLFNIGLFFSSFIF